jgi:uncharacterized membrane protein YfcA
MADGSLLALFVAATFLGAFVAGLAGFAFGLVAAAIWLHILTPLQAATLIVCYGLIVQGYAVWKLRHAFDGRRLLPLVIGGQVGIPIGVELLRWLPASTMRVAIGVVLIAFSLNALLRPKLPPMVKAGAMADGSAGVASGLVGGATGLAGIVPTIWAGLRGWNKDEQRAVFQPVAVTIFIGCALWFGGTGSFDRDTLWLFAIGLPALLIGNWAGLKVYGRLDEAAFRKIVLILLLVSGVALVVPSMAGLRS